VTQQPIPGSQTTPPVFVESLEARECNGFLAVFLYSREGAHGFALSRPLKPERVARGARLLARLGSGFHARDFTTLYRRLESCGGDASERDLRMTDACLELAMLDLVGRVDGVPVAGLPQNPRRRRLPLYWSSKRRASPPEAEMEEIARVLSETGIAAVKLNVGRGSGQGDDAEDPSRRAEHLIPLARERLGDATTIYIDGNGSFSPARAIEVARIARDFGIAWFEEPCPGTDLAGMAHVARAAGLPLAAGERAVSIEWFERAIACGACQIVQPDLWMIGGYGRALGIARHAASHGVPTVLHHPQGPVGYAYSLHFAAMVENPGAFQEYRGGLESTAHWFLNRPRIIDGCLDLPDAPGFGMSVEPEAICRELAGRPNRTFISRWKGRLSRLVKPLIADRFTTGRDASARSPDTDNK
jgi:L-alanine-DL-glutamate epimerase-like enolase superfamily enzyme